MGRAYSSSVWGGRWRTEVLRVLPEWSDLRQPKNIWCCFRDAQTMYPSTPMLNLLGIRLV